MARSLPDTAGLPGREHQPEPPGNSPLLVFDLNGISCGLSLSEIREVLPMCELLRPPALPPLLEGFLNLRGEVVPVIRIDRLFGLAAVQLRLHTHLLVVQRRPPLALLVDRVRDIMAVEAGASLETPREHVFGDCLKAVFRTGTHDISLLRLDRLLLREEESRIADFLGIAERRLNELGKASL
jgi:purine-binding chemotaxis protein CheW